MREASETLVFVEYRESDGETVAVFSLEGAPKPLIYTRRALEGRLANLVAADNPRDATASALRNWQKNAVEVIDDPDESRT